MTGPGFGIRVGIDATGSKQGADVHVQSIESIKRASGGLTPVLGTQKATIDALVASLRQMGIAEDRIQKQILTVAAAQREAAAASDVQSKAIGSSLVLYQKQWTMSAEVTAQIQKEAAARRALANAAATASLATAQSGSFFPQSMNAASMFPRNQAAEQEAVRNAIALKQRADEAAVSLTYAAAQTTKLGVATTGSVVGSTRATNALQGLAFAASGLPGPMGRVASSLGMLAVGSSLTIGITAGVAAIIFIWDKLTSKAREAKKATDDLIASLLEEARVRSGQTARENRASIEARLAAQSAEEARFAAFAARGAPGSQREIELQQATDKAREQNLKERAETIRALGALYVQDAEKYVAAVEQENAKDRERANDLKRQATDAARLREERLKQLGVLGDAERQNALETATTSRAEIAALVAIREAKIASQVIGSGLKGEEAERLRLLLRQSEVMKEQLDQAKRQGDEEARLNQIYAEFLEERAARATAHRNAQIDEEKRLNDIFSEFLEERAARQERIDAHTVDMARDVGRLLNDGFKDFFARGLKDWTAFFFAVQQLAGDVAQQIAKDIAFKTQEGLNVSGLERSGGRVLGGAAAGLGIGLASGNPFAGGIGGAAAGFAVGGPLGAIAGGVSGFVSGLLGSAAKMRQAAEAFHQGKIAFDQNLADFAAIANPRGALGDSLAALQKQLVALQKEAAQQAALATGGGSYNPKLHGGRTQAEETALSAAELQKELDAMNKAIAAGGSGRGARDYVATLLAIAKAYEDNVRAIKEQIALQRQQYREDLTAEKLRLQGQTDEAALAELRLRNQREYDALLKSFGTDVLTEADLTLLKLTSDVGVLREEALRAAQALAAVDKAFQSQISEFGLQAREAAARGDQPGAGLATLQANITEANRQYAAGLLDTDHWLRTLAVITREYNNAIEETAKALAVYNQTAREELSIRLLVAQGLDAAADNLRFRIAQERELAQAIKDGADATTIALLNQVQSAEAIARSAQLAADASRRLAEALAAEARASEDLAVRALRASGQGGAADTGAQLFAQQEERRRAIEAGRSKAFLEELDRVQAAERARADADRRAAQQATFDQAFPTTTSTAIADSATTVNLAVGLSETTGSRMTGLLASALTYQASLPRIEAILRAMQASGRSPGGPSIDDLDAGLESLDSAAERAAGILPGNR